MTPKQKRQRFDSLYQMGCIVCRLRYDVYSPPEIHHLRGNQWSGMGQRANDEHTIGLCPIHHRYGGGDDVGYHQSPKEFERRYGTQSELLEKVNEMLNDDATPSARGQGGSHSCGAEGVRTSVRNRT